MDRTADIVLSTSSRRNMFSRAAAYTVVAEIGSLNQHDGCSHRLGVIPDARVFGAVGNGIVDDAPAIQEALDTTGAVLLPHGTWRLSRPIMLKPGNQVLGSSRRSYPIALPYNTIIAPDPGVDAFILPATGAFHDLSVEGLHIVLSGNMDDPDRVALHGKRIGVCGFFCACRSRYEVLQNALFRELTITHREMGKGCGFFFQRMPYSSTFERLWLHGLEHGIAVGVYGTKTVERVTAALTGSSIHVKSHGLLPGTSIAFYWDLTKDWQASVKQRQVYYISDVQGDSFTVAENAGGPGLVLPELAGFPVYVARAGSSFDEWYADANTFLSIKMQSCETNLVLANMSASFFYNLEMYSGAFSFALLRYPSLHREQNWGLGFFGFYNEGPYPGYKGSLFSLLEGHQCTFIGRIYSPLHIRGNANTFRTIVQPRIEQRTLGEHDITIIDGHQNRLEIFAAYDLELGRIDDRGVENELRFNPRWSSGRSTLGRSFTNLEAEQLPVASPHRHSSNPLFVPGHALYVENFGADAPFDRTAQTRRPLRIKAEPANTVRLRGWAGTNNPITSWRVGQSVPQAKGLCLCRLRAIPAVVLDLTLVAGDDRIGWSKSMVPESWSVGRVWYDAGSAHINSLITLELGVSEPVNEVFIDWVLLTPFIPQLMAGTLLLEQQGPEKADLHPAAGTAEMRYDSIRQRLVVRLPDGSERVVAFEPEPPG